MNAGSIVGGINAIYAYGILSLSNAGTIQAGSYRTAYRADPVAIYARGFDNQTDLLENSGTISAIGEDAIELSQVAGSAIVTNSGRIITTATNALTVGGNADKVTNSGTMIGNVRLGAGDDTFDGRGGIVRGVIYGQAGNDTIHAGDASATVDGGTGQDTLYGGSGDDTLSATDGGDKLYGGAGGDVITADGGNNIVSGGDGDDTLIVSGGTSAIDGGAGTDTLVLSATASSTVDLRFSARNTGDAAGDTIRNVENLTGGDFADTLTGDAGDNVLTGGLGNDLLNGMAGSDDLLGGAGNDTFFLSAGSDVIDGGDGADQISLANATLGATLNLSLVGGQSWNGTDFVQVTNVEGIHGSAFADMLTGDSNGNTLVGGSGNDRIDGAGGSDLILGGAGDDMLTGGSGTDTVSYSDATAGVTVSLAVTAQQNTIGAGRDTLAQFEYVTGSDFADMLTGDNANNKLAGDDMLVGGAGDDTLNGGANTDMAIYADATGDTFVDLALTAAQNTNGAGIDTLTAIESLTGSSFDDVLRGTAQNNTLIGGGGVDTLYGRGGNDILTGGTGSDTFVFDTAPVAGSLATITDFTRPADQISLSLAAFTGIAGTAGSSLAASMFYQGTSAGDADDRIGYDTATGRLFYDADGAGGQAAIQFATLTGVPSIDNFAFVLAA